MNTPNDPPPPPTEPVPPPAPTEGTGLPPNVAAGLAALFPLIGGIVFIILEKKDALVRFTAMQSIYFGATLFILGLAGTISGLILAFIPLIGWFLGLLLTIAMIVLWVVFLVLWLIGAIKAFQGVRWEMPLLGPMARSQLAKIDGPPPGGTPTEP